ncbi:MAG: hypothetical protein Q8N96_07890 [Methylovulum sp.]|nr:hypothetical protein [Methylovulum sp.]
MKNQSPPFLTLMPFKDTHNKRPNPNPNPSSKFKFALTPVIAVLFGAAPIAIAVPSQYCSKLSAHMRYLVCDMSFHDNGKLLGLDYQVSLVYEFALFSSNYSPKLKKNQRRWLKKKELCQDRDCVVDSNRNRIRELEAIVDGHPGESASPENGDLKGLWFSDGRAEARYGTILITDHVIIWGGSEAATKFYCKTNYSIEKEPYGTTFDDVFGDTYTLNESSQFKTYKLKLKPHKCIGNLAYLRFTLPYKIPNYANIVEYDSDGLISWHFRFGKYHY